MHLYSIGFRFTNRIAIFDQSAVFDEIAGKTGDALNQSRTGYAGDFEFDFATNEWIQPERKCTDRLARPK